MQDNLFLHFIALIYTWLNAKFHAKYTLKQVQGNKFLVQKRLAGRGLKLATLSPRARLMPANKQSAKFGTKVQKQSGKSLHYKQASNSKQLGIIADKNTSKLS